MPAVRREFAGVEDGPGGEDADGRAIAAGRALASPRVDRSLVPERAGIDGDAATPAAVIGAVAREAGGEDRRPGVAKIVAAAQVERRRDRGPDGGRADDDGADGSGDGALVHHAVRD